MSLFELMIRQIYTNDFFFKLMFENKFFFQQTHGQLPVSLRVVKLAQGLAQE